MIHGVRFMKEGLTKSDHTLLCRAGQEDLIPQEKTFFRKEIQMRGRSLMMRPGELDPPESILSMDAY